jgi:membrane-associated protease RseP (regulator of RpoE activity)
METKKTGDSVSVVVARGENWIEKISLNISVVEYDERPVIGVNFLETKTDDRLNLYLNPRLETILLYFQPPTLSLLPFSKVLSVLYSHPMGDNWYTVANTFFWIWFININLAIFNTLPIYPLDGGRLFEGLLKTLLGDNKKKKVMRIIYASTLAIVFILAMNIVLPYIL